LIGQVISHYKILEKLGEGGMGVVYKANDTRLDRQVALKFLPERVNQDATEKARFLQEAKAAAALNHPHICTIHGVEESGSSIFIVMEYVDGGTIRGKIPFGKVDDAVSAAIQVCEALQEAHEHGIVHRDVKADNVMLTGKGQVKVMDFGLAKLKGSLKLTKTSSTVGTIGYMAPEQIQGGEVDHRSDIFSFGVLLFEMLTGKLPFRGEHEAAMVYSIVNEEPADIVRLVPELPPVVANLVGRCLEKDPGERYQHFDDVIADLKRSQKKTSRVMTSSSRVSTAAAARRGGKLVPAVIAAGVVAILAVAAWLFLPGQGPAEGGEKTIAVLPFENMSGTDDAAFSAGITEDILTQISKIADLRVLSRFTLKEYDSKGKSPAAIGTELGVAHLLVGSIRRSGDRLRIGCQLIATSDGREIWAETYDRTMADVFAIQSEVATEIARTLKAQLSSAEKGRIDRRPTQSTEAYGAYLSGRELYEQRTAEANSEAIEFFKKAVALDASFALPYAGLADAYLQDVIRYRGLSRDWSDSAEASAWRAISLDPEAAEGWKALGLAFQITGRLDSAETCYLKAIEKNPNHLPAVGNLGLIYDSRGQADEAVRWYRRGLELNPTASYSYVNLSALYWTLGMDSNAMTMLDRLSGIPGYDQFYYHLGRTFVLVTSGERDRALKQIDSMLAAASHSASYEWAGALSLGVGETRLAGERFREALRRSPEGAEEDPNIIAGAGLGFVLWQEGKRDSATMLLERALRVQQKVIAEGNATSVNETLAAGICATLGNKDEALDHLARSLELGTSEIRLIAINPMLDPLRGDPRFKNIVGDMGTKLAAMRKKVEAMDRL
jgi:TolB-like protein/Tfp pilus assembly protein PilF